jgi:hypothetical protein
MVKRRKLCGKGFFAEQHFLTVDGNKTRTKNRFNGAIEMTTVERKFEAELRDKAMRAKKECHYNPTRFNQMLAEYGGVDTAKALIKSAKKTGNPSEGFTTLLLCGRLDLSMEDSVCKPEYQPLFAADEIAYCKEILGR